MPSGLNPKRLGESGMKCRRFGALAGVPCSFALDSNLLGAGFRV